MNGATPVVNDVPEIVHVANAKLDVGDSTETASGDQEERTEIPKEGMVMG